MSLTVFLFLVLPVWFIGLVAGIMIQRKKIVPRKFVEWYVTKGQFEHRFTISKNKDTLDYAYEYWLINIKDKK